MNNELIDNEIATDKSMERIVNVIREQVVLVFQEYQAFNKNIEFFSSMDADVKILQKYISKVEFFKAVCLKELNEFNQKYGTAEKQNLIEYLNVMIKDIEEYNKNLILITAALANNDLRMKEKLREKIMKSFKILFDTYEEFIKADEGLISTLTHLKKT